MENYTTPNAQNLTQTFTQEQVSRMLDIERQRIADAIKEALAPFCPPTPEDTVAVPRATLQTLRDQVAEALEYAQEAQNEADNVENTVYEVRVAAENAESSAEDAQMALDALLGDE